MHEWVESEHEKAPIGGLGAITWVFDADSFVPSAKLVGDKSYSIISDYLGTPEQAYDENGNKVWECELDIYGNVRNLTGKIDFVPFRYQGQYHDIETDLYYNRFRYYAPNEGAYICQDPIRLESGEFNLYNYVNDTNNWIDEFGLARGAATGAYKDLPTIDGYQKHHIVADSLKDHPLLKQVGFDVNSGKNLVYLPTSRRVDRRRTVHNGSHRAWHKKDMKAELDRIHKMNASPSVKKMHLEAHVDNMRKKYMQKKKSVQLNKHH